MKNKSFKWVTLFVLLLSSLLLVAYFNRDRIIPLFFDSQEPEGVEEGVDEEQLDEGEIEIVIDNLDVPWEIVFLPEGDFLVTQRTGTLLHVLDSEIVSTFDIGQVKDIGEGGLLGLALHPAFEQNSYVYLYLTIENSGNIENEVLRYTYEDGEFVDETVIIENIPGGRIHNGGRIGFGPDGYLYITTGDAGETNLSQDTNSLAGKILRITDQGDVPEDNPFNNEVYSYGHRNPQGLIWDETAQLWATEHGPSARDELNLISIGENYGWPEITGTQEREGMRSPILISGEDYTWAPSGGTYWDGSIFFGGLRGQSVFEAKVIDNEVDSLSIHFEKEYGRIRNVKLGPDGMMYILTNNTDGRGSPDQTDDKIIRVNPLSFR